MNMIEPKIYVDLFPIKWAVYETSNQFQLTLGLPLGHEHVLICRVAGWPELSDNGEAFQAGLIRRSFAEAKLNTGAFFVKLGGWHRFATCVEVQLWGGGRWLRWSEFYGLPEAKPLAAGGP